MQLKGLKRVELGPWEAKEINFIILPDDLQGLTGK